MTEVDQVRSSDCYPGAYPTTVQRLDPCLLPEPSANAGKLCEGPPWIVLLFAVPKLLKRFSQVAVDAIPERGFTKIAFGKKATKVFQIEPSAPNQLAGPRLHDIGQVVQKSYSVVH